MGFETRHNAIRKRFQDEIQDGIPIVVLYDNDPTEKPENAEWIRLTILPGESLQVSIGDNKRFRHPGVAMAQVFTLIEKGDQRALELADLIQVAFRSRTEDGVTYRTPSVIVVGRSGGWHQVNVNIPFFQDDFETP